MARAYNLGLLLRKNQHFLKAIKLMKARKWAYLRIYVFKFVFLTGGFVFLTSVVEFSSTKFELKNPLRNQNNKHRLFEMRAVVLIQII